MNHEQLIEEMAALDYEFTVQSLLYAFDVLALIDVYPHKDEETCEFWMGQENGEMLPREDMPALARVLGVIRHRTPLAVVALDKVGESGPFGVEATGAFLEAYDRWNN
jgi:hypothetical protein